MTLSGPPEPQRTNLSVETALVSAGQRRVNIIWERTQAAIALSVVIVTLAAAGFKAVFDALSDPERGIAAGPAFLFLVGASNLVIGFYFGRTNHQRTGGVGEHAPTEVSGR